MRLAKLIIKSVTEGIQVYPVTGVIKDKDETKKKSFLREEKSTQAQTESEVRYVTVTSKEICF